MTAARKTEAEEAAFVEAYLRAHPGFLAARPGLYAVLAPPRRVHGEVLADHMAAMIQAGRAEWRQVLAAGRTGRSFAAKVAEAVLALIAAADPRDCVRHEWPSLLGVEHATLLPHPAPAALTLRDTPAPTPSGMVRPRRWSAARPCCAWARPRSPSAPARRRTCRTNPNPWTCWPAPCTPACTAHDGRGRLPGLPRLAGAGTPRQPPHGRGLWA
ncbi:hypothetical protein [Roseococcus microcysteis]|uniref:hypothetical protein n=1 Tax=Roseococcus microcysteis TaxID=2771361 RepID=UPI00168B335D|nr:hypothetical protein [Roseococcus microcysteis]